MIDFIHKTHPRSRTLKVKVEANGQVVVVTPPRFPLPKIEQFVQEHMPWIRQTQEKIALRRQHTTPPNTVSIFGKNYQQEVVFSRDLPVGVHIQGRKLIINTINGEPGKPSVAEATTQLDRFLKQTAEKYIVPRTHQLADAMGISFGRITLRNQKTRWGSCSSQGNLNFNWRLVQYAPSVIDYVIIHELAHRREMNHSHRFWRIVREFDPAYEEHRRWLRRHGWAEG